MNARSASDNDLYRALVRVPVGKLLPEKKLKRLDMTNARRDGLYLFVLGCAVFLLLGTFLESVSAGSMIDFKAVYYGTRTLLHHGDPYNKTDLMHVYLAEDGAPQAKKLAFSDIVALNVNLPTAFPFIAPFALLPWAPAHLLWMLLTAGSFILAAYLMWDLGAAFAPVLSGGLLCLFLVGSELLIQLGNTAGTVVSLCAIATWCFLRERFTSAGILCLAIGLLVKPHDAGFIWLFFLLTGGIYRKRALQTLVLVAALGLPALLWVSYVAPNWMQEVRSNILVTSARGGINDPALIQDHVAGMISLQTAVSVFQDDPRIYNALTYLICAPLVFVWVYTTLRGRSSGVNAWLALAAIAALYVAGLSSATRHKAPATHSSGLRHALV